MEPLDRVVLDLELAEPVEAAGGWDRTDRMKVACVCLWDHGIRRARVLGEGDMRDLRRRLFDADRISGFGIAKFDLPIVFGMTPEAFAVQVPELAPKVDDILQRIWTANDRLGQKSKGWNLQRVALGTLGVSKIGDGKDVPDWWKAGLFHKVVNYCLDDVCLERDLCEHIDTHGWVRCMGRMLELPPWKAEKETPPENVPGGGESGSAAGE